MALHGYFRPSTSSDGTYTDKADLDFWYNPTYDNYYRLLDALEVLGQDVSAFREEQTPNPKKSFFRYDFDKFTLDLLPELKSDLTFKASFIKRETSYLNEIAIPFLGYDDLIADKEINSRPKDIIDLEQLKKIKKSTE